MSVVKVVEIIASSDKGFEDAVQNAVTQAAKTIKNIDSVYVKHAKCHVKDGRVITYGVNCKISFRVE